MVTTREIFEKRKKNHFQDIRIEDMKQNSNIETKQILTI